MTRVLLIDDDVELTGLLAEYLTEEGFEVRAFADGREGVKQAVSGAYDIVVLDVMMPRMNGVEVLQRIRRECKVPVLMLTARGDDVDRISGLNLGADDYVSKPSSSGELVARLRAILRRTSTAERSEAAAEIQAGQLTLHPGSRRAIWQGNDLDLTGTEFNLLEVLARHVGTLVTKEDLSVQALGRQLTAYDRSIDVHISSIRQKLGPCPNGQSWIRNQRGSGYQLSTEG